MASPQDPAPQTADLGDNPPPSNGAADVIAALPEWLRPGVSPGVHL